MRYSIWSAVSTTAQATPDKISLTTQLEKCRFAVAPKGWSETSGPYIVPGASRSFYVNLSDAENDIPPLKQMLEDARNNLFDVLVIYSYDRLGDLVDMISQSLRFYGKQLYSITQPAEPQDPDHFDPYSSEGEGIIRDVARITQRFRINDLRRKWKAGMPARIARGLTPLRVPFSYIWVGKKDPPRLDPQRAALLLQMKNLLFQGRSLKDIARHAESTGIMPPNGGVNWDVSTIRYILANPYYAGIVTLNRSASVHDPRRKNQTRQVDQPRAKWTTGVGKHETIWDEATHRSILHELERRHAIHKNYAVRFPLSGLLICSVCGQKLHRRMNGNASTGRKRVLSCAEGPSHIILPYQEGIELVARELATQLERAQAQPIQTQREDSSMRYQAALQDLAKRRVRIQEGFEAGLYAPLEARQKLTELETQIETIQADLEASERAAQVRAEFSANFPNLSHFPEWVQEDDPAIVHRLLMALCEQITITPQRQIQITWRS